MYELKEPTQTISKDAIKVWRLTDALVSTVVLIVLIGLLFVDTYYQWSSWIGIVLYVLIAVTIVSALIECTVMPVYRQKTWRYEIDAQCIQLKHGAFMRTHLIIPIEKIYFVKTSQGPLSKQYGLATVKIGTIGYVHDIPSLPLAQATEITQRITALSDRTSRKERADATGTTHDFR
ncbi:PH domain-containing protein [Exiguobacterium acetylicum]|uniref:PH domain-containing protein n=1 Tax=Exiguobacterium acetylicum TaxID=41170 RepID=UPI0039777A1D